MLSWYHDCKECSKIPGNKCICRKCTSLVRRIGYHHKSDATYCACDKKINHNKGNPYYGYTECKSFETDWVKEIKYG